MKCSNSVVALNQPRDGLLTMITKTGELYYCSTKDIIFLERFTNIGELKKLVSYLNQDIRRLYTPDNMSTTRFFYAYCGSVCLLG